jgi:hypothetical protein
MYFHSSMSVIRRQRATVARRPLPRHALGSPARVGA